MASVTRHNFPYSGGHTLTKWVAPPACCRLGDANALLTVSMRSCPAVGKPPRHWPESVSMNVALRLEPAQELKQPRSVGRAGRFSHIEILDDLTLAEPIWRRLEREDALTTPYQSFSLLSA